MKKLFTISAILCALSLGSCTKAYRCECKANYSTAMPIAYKPGTEKEAKDTCEKAGCVFKQY